MTRKVETFLKKEKKKHASCMYTLKSFSLLGWYVLLFVNKMKLGFSSLPKKVSGFRHVPCSLLFCPKTKKKACSLLTDSTIFQRGHFVI